MNEIMNFVKEILMLNTKDGSPIGLCQFEGAQEPAPKVIRQKRKREMRLSELMDK